MVADEENVTRTSAPVTTSVTIQPVNDEAPEITNTSSVVVFIEERGPISIVDGGVAIIDLDNCANHTIVVQLTVRLENPIAEEDQLIVDGVVYENYTATFSCDAGVNSSCYEDFLRSIEYNNTNVEPDPQQRIVSIQVCGVVVIESCISLSHFLSVSHTHSLSLSLSLPLSLPLSLMDVLVSCIEYLYLQAYDMAWNSAPFNITIKFDLINDNMFSLLLDAAAGGVNYTIAFLEGQNYPGFPGTTPVPLFDRLGLSDDDSGLNNLTNVTISFVGGMLVPQSNKFRVKRRLRSKIKCINQFDGMTFSCTCYFRLMVSYLFT